jgi:lysophospholipase L1-like esterase
MLKQMRAHGTLPHMIVIALGANGTVSGTQIGQTLGVLGRHRLLVLMTPRELGGGSGADAATERAEAARHRGRILLLDWVRFSAGHGSWFAPDGLHLNPAGVDAFTALIDRSYGYAYVPCPLRFRPQVVRTARVAVRTRPYAAPIGLHVSDKHVGYIDARITGPPGIKVQLTETGQSTPLGSPVQIPRSGTVTVPKVTTWQCAVRSRSFVASTVGLLPAETATDTITTPSCAHRLNVSISKRAKVGKSVTVRLTDTWGLGALPVRICFAPPGAAAGCHMRPLGSGQTHRVVTLSTPRVGGWNVRVVTPYGQRIGRRVWASHPGRVRFQLDGDSEMQILDTFIGQALSPFGVATSSDARQSTGLTNSVLYNWQAAARRQAASFRPDVSIVIMGANDGFSTPGPHGVRESCCGSAWSDGYGTLVAQMMKTLLRGNAGRVYWITLPTPRPGNFKSVFDGVNRGIRAAAARFPGRVGLINANAFFTPGDRYRDFMSYHGHGFTIHEADGIHLGPAGDHVLVSLIVDRLKADHVIR